MTIKAKKVLTAFFIAFLLIHITNAKIFLPGMQPKEANIEFVKTDQCKMCHGGTTNGDADPYLSWKSGMMSNAARDPIFFATMTISNQDLPGVGEFCLRCHAPRGWLEDRSTPADASALTIEDKQGVNCDVCHRLIDSQSEEAASLIKYIPPGYGNAMMVADPANTVRGPYGDSTGAMPHTAKKSEFHSTGNLCGTCHDISNPVAATDVNSQPPYSFGHIERTYSEWVLSDFAKRGKDGSCQSCHYPVVKGGGQASRFEDTKRDYFVTHGPVGGSIWAQEITWLLNGEGMDAEARNLGKKKAEAMLKSAASLELTFQKKEKAALRITNLTGHKLPTGYPEGRRMWINVQFLSADGSVLKEIGKYGPKDDEIFGKAVKVPTLLDAEETTVYEIVPGISEEQSKKFGKPAGASFHFVLNDIIVKDNRIPPEGFNNEEFAKHISKPVGAEYADGQYWDDVEIDLPAKCDKVVAKLMYQSVSWEYIKFLAEENKTDDWGKKLYDGWKKTGQCEPTVMAQIERKVSD